MGPAPLSDDDDTRPWQDAIDPSVAAADSFRPIQPSTLPLSSESDRVAHLKSMVAPHIDSFNFAMGNGIEILPEMIPPVVLHTDRDKSKDSGGKPVRIEVRYTKLSVVKPRHQESSQKVLAADILPNECRRAGVSYTGDLLAEYGIFVGDESVDLPPRRIARIPMMVCSDKCNLAGKRPQQLVDMGEEQYELGGYFIINGAEKLLRMIIVPRANAVISVRRDNNLRRGPLYTDVSVSIRSMRRDLSTTTVHMHYLRTGGANVRISVGLRSEYFIPVGVLIRALLPSGVTPRAIFDMILGGEKSNEALRASALAIVTDLDDWSKKFRPSPEESESVHVSMSQKAALTFVGSSFRVVLSLDENVSDIEAGYILFQRYVLAHLSQGPYEPNNATIDAAKADMLVHMVRKLVAVAAEEIEVDNGDAPSHQELLLPGQLYLNYLKERLESQLLSVGLNIRREMSNTSDFGRGGLLTVPEAVQKAMGRVMKQDIVSAQMNYFLATGNLKTEKGLDLPQVVGYAIMAERINYLRFISHFRCVHRGAFYATMRTTKVRKLLPEAWGFICPVQTPDGAPCGLLNHLASEVEVTIGNGTNLLDFGKLMLEIGATPAPSMSNLQTCSDTNSLPIVCDGQVVGYVPERDAPQFANLVRQLKSQPSVLTVPLTTEVAYVAPVRQKSCGFYPGIYIHTTGCRMMRPVTWLQRAVPRKGRKSQAKDAALQINDEDGSADCGTREMIGTFEQVYLQVRPALVNAEDSVTPVNVDNATHSEITSHGFMSDVPALTPFLNMNQGPRNIFQCQMAKQTMGTPCHRFDSRFDSKVYRLTTPQVPITRNRCMQDPMGADLFPNGTNGVVAVISYTGYDMEDALILNQGSVNRGFAHGTVYANKRLNLDENAVDRARQFGPLSPAESSKTSAVDTDGLPVVGARVRYEEPLYATAPLGSTAMENSKNPRNMRWTNHKSVETATVDQVQVVNGGAYAAKEGARSVKGYVRQATIRTRVARAPAVGDKFATRAGQKGTVASVWPTEDMPFSESGMVPDVLFNPNGFPSRMTIGMMVENMAGKSGALHGMFHDSTPFRFDEKCRAVDFFGDQLKKAGYNYYGNETLYSGYTGEPFEVDIFMGVIHYQRLRHMVSDKFQVRSTGKIHPIYRQPIQGRKRGGAIRFGEMERDGLLAHGASFLLRDRLAMASDMHVLHVCNECGSLLSPTMDPDARQSVSTAVSCRDCVHKKGERNADSVFRVALPYSFKYLVHELAAMNIRTRLDLRPTEDVALRGPNAK